jgi:hypothetical protein
MAVGSVCIFWRNFEIGNVLSGESWYGHLHFALLQRPAFWGTFSD